MCSATGSETPVPFIDPDLGPPIDPGGRLLGDIRQLLVRAQAHEPAPGSPEATGTAGLADDLLRLCRDALYARQDGIVVALERLAHVHHPDNWAGHPTDRLDHITLDRIAQRLFNGTLVYDPVSRPLQHYVPLWREVWSWLTRRAPRAACGEDMTDTGPIPAVCPQCASRMLRSAAVPDRADSRR